MRLTAPRLTLAAAASAAVLCVTACSSTANGRATGPALQSYSCCSSRDILTVRHPGETMRLHWIATPLAPSSNSAVSTVRMKASLSGPFGSVSQLKASHSPVTMTAPTVITTDRVGGAPVSIILIPEDARAGEYNLTTTVDQDSGQISGGSVIQVSAKN
jgi:hypothetical protein